MPVKVSVIVPAYNPGSYIDECIASILRQSLPADEYEAIFVDDGSTDGTGARLDALAAQHANITAIHIPNSGWPGRPRNVGIDAAVGRYVYFVDNDDWIGDEALERLYERAERNDADVVVGKEVGHGKGVPRPLFRRNVDDATLTGTPLLDLLTPHKLFRRSFLDEHGIRFPEGRRRLEDHVFVMKAFFSARRISILADYPCYHWLLREDASNATDRYAEPVAYYENVREVLDVVDEFTEPGPARDRFYAHWYRSKGLHRLRGWGWAEGPDEYELEVFSEVRRLALERFGPGVAQGLAARFRVISRSVLADRPDLVSVQARIELGMRVEVALISIDCVDTRLRLSLSATLTYADDTPIKLARRSGRIYWQLPAPLAGDSAILDEDLDVTSEVARTRVNVVLRHRDSGTEYDVPATGLQSPDGAGDGEIRIAHRAQVDIDLLTVATGSELQSGTWDILVHIYSCGWDAVRALPCTVEQLRAVEPVVVVSLDFTATPCVTETGTLAVNVEGRPMPGPSSARNGSVSLVGRLRRMAPPRVRRWARRVLAAVEPEEPLMHASVDR